MLSLCGVIKKLTPRTLKCRIAAGLLIPPAELESEREKLKGKHSGRSAYNASAGSLRTSQYQAKGVSSSALHYGYIKNKDIF